MLIRDSVILDASGLKLTQDGYLIGDAKVSRAGNVQHYYGSEIGLTGADAGKVFGVYRDPDTVFDEAAMLSLAGRPVTRGHPDDAVTADNWKNLAKGQVGGTIKRDGEHVVAPMAIMDGDAVKEVVDGARSLSAGYTVQVVADAGTAPDGTPYQYRQASPLRFNHVAYLPDNNPRAGNTRIGDAADGGIDRTRWGARPSDSKGTSVMTDKTTQIVRDGLPVNVPEAQAPIISKWLSDADKAIAAADKALADEKSAHAAALATKDTEIGELKGKLKDAEGKALDEAALDQRVADRAELVAQVKALDSKIEVKGAKDADLRRKAVVSKHGEEFAKDMSDAEITGVFKSIAKDVKPTNPLSTAIEDMKPADASDWGKSVFDSAGVTMKKGA